MPLLDHFSRRPLPCLTSTSLLSDLRVDTALSLPPGLPSSVLFLCVCQADCGGDGAQARSLCSAAVTAMKAAVKVTSICPRHHMARVVTEGESLTSDFETLFASSK